jgi:hypothetical protein
MLATLVLLWALPAATATRYSYTRAMATIREKKGHFITLAKNPVQWRRCYC